MSANQYCLKNPDYDFLSGFLTTYKYLPVNFVCAAAALVAECPGIRINICIEAAAGDAVVLTYPSRIYLRVSRSRYRPRESGVPLRIVQELAAKSRLGLVRSRPQVWRNRFPRFPVSGIYGLERFSGPIPANTRASSPEHLPREGIF